MGKYFFLLACILFTMEKANAQSAYWDVAAWPVMELEKFSTEKAKKGYEDTNKEVKKLAIPAFLEFISRGKMPVVAQQVFPLTYINVCNDFWIPAAIPSRKRQLCQRRYQYLVESERIVREFVNTSTRYRLNQGVRKQIMEEYIKIMNNIEYQLELMQIEKDKRSIVRSLFP